MGQYRWTQNHASHLWTLGNPPTWWNTAATPVQVVATQSPGGAGDVLKRCEISCAMSGTVVGDPIVIDAWQMPSITMLFLGEVYPTGVAGFPDPSASGTVRAVISAAAAVRSLSMPDQAHSKISIAYSTDGYVTSKGQRGPAQYGGGHPELRIGMYAMNVADAFLPGELDSSELFTVRALWYTP